MTPPPEPETPVRSPATVDDGPDRRDPAPVGRPSGPVGRPSGPVGSGAPQSAPPYRDEDRAAAAARLEAARPGYLEQVRRRADDMGVPKTPVGRARKAVSMVVATARINPDVPTHSRRRVTALVKRGVAVLTRFYVLHLTEQLTELGESTSWMGTAICDYVAGLEAEVADLRARVARLEEERSPS
ncbi:MAG: hypothetical protein KGQ66_14005 [Acidobacteriota bacterium]|nr:hypothetical protein [Acidobacteriota bacterium]